MEDYAGTERISSLDAGADKEKRSLLERASDVARGVLESIQTIAGTTNCKGVQILQLKKWAQEEGCWIEDINRIGVKEDRGSENEVYRSLTESNVLYKLNDFRYSEDNLTPFFVRIKVHNHYFGNCPYDFLGMAENSDGKVCALISQPFIHAEREATEEEIHDAFIKMGFHAEMDGEYYSNGIYDVFDALPNNVLWGVDGFPYFIDTIIYPTDNNSWDMYHKMSPRFSDENPKVRMNMNIEDEILTSLNNRDEKILERDRIIKQKDEQISKLVESQITSIKLLLANGLSPEIIAQNLNVSLEFVEAQK